MSDDLQNLHYIVNHVFCPPKLPQEDDQAEGNDSALCACIFEAAEAYRDELTAPQRIRWDHMLKMLENLWISQQSKMLSDDHVKQAMMEMRSGGRSVEPLVFVELNFATQMFLPS
jgi:hypothetical protein